MCTEVQGFYLRCLLLVHIFIHLHRNLMYVDIIQSFLCKLKTNTWIDKLIGRESTGAGSSSRKTPFQLWAGRNQDCEAFWGYLLILSQHFHHLDFLHDSLKLLLWLSGNEGLVHCAPSHLLKLKLPTEKALKYAILKKKVCKNITKKCVHARTNIGYCYMGRSQGVDIKCAN